MLIQSLGGRRNLADFFVFIDCISFMQDHIIVAT